MTANLIDLRSAAATTGNSLYLWAASDSYAVSSPHLDPWLTQGRRYPRYAISPFGCRRDLLLEGLDTVGEAPGRYSANKPLCINSLRSVRGRIGGPSLG